MNRVGHGIVNRTLIWFGHWALDRFGHWTLDRFGHWALDRFGHWTLDRFGHWTLDRFGHWTLNRFGHWALNRFGHWTLDRFGHWALDRFGRFLSGCLWSGLRCVFCRHGYGDIDIEGGPRRGLVLCGFLHGVGWTCLDRVRHSRRIVGWNLRGDLLMRRVGGGLFGGVAVLVYTTGRDYRPSIYGQSDTLVFLSSSVIKSNVLRERRVQLT
jgi:hypothetical protein